MTRIHIHFLHDNRAAYPEIAAYREYFQQQAATSEGPEPPKAGSLSVPLVMWRIMGFHPMRRRDAFEVHDYRSLSVGPAAIWKDRIKRLFNARPDLRIFQNETMARQMGFRDQSHIFLPMGVPNWIAGLRSPTGSDRHDFGYLGAISRERGFDRVIAQFLSRYPSGKTLLLIGPVEDAIRARFGDDARLVFTGMLPQRDALERLKEARVAVSVFPRHRPHAFQTPTKLLEYAALGLRILANDSPMNLATARALGLRVTFTTDNVFTDAADDAASSPSNEDFDPTPLFWNSVIEQSEVGDRLGRLRDRMRGS